MSEFITHSREETVALGAQVAQHLAPGALIAFTGGLGAGKTAFCEGIARGSTTIWMRALWWRQSGARTSLTCWRWKTPSTSTSSG